MGRRRRRRLIGRRARLIPAAIRYANRPPRRWRRRRPWCFLLPPARRCADYSDVMEPATLHQHPFAFCFTISFSFLLLLLLLLLLLHLFLLSRRPRSFSSSSFSIISATVFFLPSFGVPGFEVWDLLLFSICISTAICIFLFCVCVLVSVCPWFDRPMPLPF